MTENTIIAHEDADVALIRILPVGYRTFVVDGLFFKERVMEIVRKRSTIRHEIVMHSSLHVFGRFYNLDGQHIPGHRVDTGIHLSVLDGRNTLQRLEDGIFVSDGPYIPVADTIVDGEPAVVFRSVNTSEEDFKAEREKTLASFYADHGDIVDRLRPAWAEEATPLTREDHPTVSYSLDIGEVRISQYVVLKRGEWKTKKPRVYIGDLSLSLADAELLAMQISAAVDSVKVTQ